MSIESDKRPKVLFLLHLPPPTYGATISNNYIKNSDLINDKFESYFINIATNKKLYEVGKATSTKVFLFFSLIIKVLKALLTKDFDASIISLTASGPAFYKDMIIVTILKLFGLKITYYFHNKGVSYASKNFINNFLYKYAFNKTKSILSSKYLYPDIKKYVKETDVFYCFYGIPLIDDMYSVERSTNSLLPCRLLFLGNMMVEKGILVLLEACKLLKENNYKFSCNFVGGWSDITENEFNYKIIQNNLSDFVFVHGPKYNLEKNWFFKNSDIFIFPTYYHYETFGLVNLEAMQHALPIISTPEGGIPDIVIHGENGFLVPQHNVLALAEKIKELIDNPGLRSKMGLAGRERFHALFTLDKFEKNISQIISELIK